MPSSRARATGCTPDDRLPWPGCRHSDIHPGAGRARFPRRPGGLTMVAGRIYWTAVPELIRISALAHTPQAFQIAAVVVMFTAANWTIVGLALSFARREPIMAIWRRTFSKAWLWIIGYFALAVVL